MTNKSPSPSSGRRQPGVMLYYDDYRPLRRLPEADRCRLIEAALDYACLGREPEFNTLETQMAWDFLLPRLELDRLAYEEKVRARTEAANKRWHKEDAEECKCIAPHASDANSSSSSNSRNKNRKSRNSAGEILL